MTMLSAPRLMFFAFVVFSLGSSAFTANTVSAQSVDTATTTPALRLEIMGTPSVLLDHSLFTAQGSRDDMPPHAYRDSKGLTHFFGANSTGYPFVGTSFNTLVQAKTQAYPSPFNPDETAFAYKNWITTAYATGGDNVYGIIHHEYHGQYVAQYKDICASHPKAGSQTCWYTASLLATSTDGGVTFHSAPGPSNVLFEIPYKFSTDMVRAGIGGAVIIKNPRDGYYYALLQVIGFGAQATGDCLARSTDKLKTWRFWTGADWSGTFINPYLSNSTPDTHVCPVLGSNASGHIDSVIYDAKDDMFVATMGRHGNDPARLDTVFSYAVSRDLIHWSAPVDFFTSHDNGDKPISYPSLLDSDSPSINFDVTDGAKELYLYYISWPFGFADNLHRDVMRVPVSLVISDTVRPTITFLTPEQGTTASGTVSLRVSANDDRTVAGVQFMLDGQKLGAEATSSTDRFTVRWDTTSTDNGVHRLQAIARDRAGNMRVATTSIRLLNRPELVITASASSTPRGEYVRIAWRATYIKPNSCAVSFIPRDTAAPLLVAEGEQGSKLYGPMTTGGRFYLSCTTRTDNPTAASVHVAVQGVR